MTPEGAIKLKIKKLLNARGVYYFMPVQMGFGASTLDFLCCSHGEFFAIEAKAPGKVLTKRQEATAKSIHMAAGRVFVVDGDLTEVVDYLENEAGYGAA